MRRLILLIAIFVTLLSKPSSVQASLIFSDSFNGGFNNLFWSVPAWGYAPIPSAFGLEYNPSYPGFYSALQYLDSLSGNFIIKIDEKINLSPASDINFGFRAPDGRWKLVQFYGVGNGGPANTIKAYDSNNFGAGLAAWDPSIGIHNFEISMSPDANSQIVVKKNGETLLSWQSSVGFVASGLEMSIYGSGSEFANFQLCDSGGCETVSPTPTPTPEPTAIPTPTSTPTPTLTPSPTPIPVTKVVVVPGMGGSWNKDALMNCRDNSDPWTSWGGSDLVYSSLLSSLQGSGFTPEPFYYDWRKQIPDLKPLLTSFINDNVVPLEKVDIVGHSMGGLVAREYIEKEGGTNKADKYYSVGAPHQGTILAYPAWSAGEIWGSLPFRIAATTVIKNCRNKYPQLSDMEIVRQFIPSVQNLLPVFDYLKWYKTNNIKPISGMDAKNNWLTTDPPLFINTLYGTLSGGGSPTLQWLDVVNPGPRDGTENWVDGKPKKKEYSDFGDGVVLNTSSVLNGGVGDKIISQDHSGLVASIEGIDAILRFLTLGTNLQPVQSQAAYTPFKTALVVMVYPADFSVTTNGKTLKDKEGIIVLMNPKSGSYNLHVLPKSESTRIIVAQFLEDKTLWKEYKWNGRSPKGGAIQFDSSNPIEDPLK